MLPASAQSFKKRCADSDHFFALTARAFGETFPNTSGCNPNPLNLLHLFQKQKRKNKSNQLLLFQYSDPNTAIESKLIRSKMLAQDLNSKAEKKIQNRIDRRSERNYVIRTLMKSDGDPAEELSLQRMQTTRSSGNPSKKSDLPALSGAGLIFFRRRFSTPPPHKSFLRLFSFVITISLSLFLHILG